MKKLALILLSLVSLSSWANGESCKGDCTYYDVKNYTTKLEEVSGNSHDELINKCNEILSNKFNVNIDEIITYKNDRYSIDRLNKLLSDGKIVSAIKGVSGQVIWENGKVLNVYSTLTKEEACK